MWISTLLSLSVAAFTIVAAEQPSESRLVQTAQGPVRGYKDQESGIYYFQGIPYASIPTGRNRYKAPLPPPIWMHPLEAVSKSIACPQPTLPDVPLFNFNQQEDCLVASVYVPDTQDTKLPVVVYVHGGAYQGGSGDVIIPDKLVAENNIIAVTFNYRVGTHGFLCLGTEDVPGNAGMKDQVAALRWVKKNIESFGGNPDDVTIAGYSAGSAAVDLLMLSKSAEGLFNKVIPESGASIGPWGIQSDPVENAKKIARYLNFTNVDDINDLEDFFKTVSYDLLVSVPFIDNKDSYFGLAPCIERPSGEEAFLDQSPIEILRSGEYRKVPLLYGFAHMEGLFRAPFFDSWQHEMDAHFSDFLPCDLLFETVEQKNVIANQIKQFYFEEKLVGENILSYIDFFTDVIFAYPMLRTVKYHIKAGHDQIYLYDYSFVDKNTPNIPHTNIKGSDHCAQTEAIFGISFKQGNEIKFTEEFLKTSKTVRSIWGSFIKTGNPIPEGSSLPVWPSVGADWSPHMSLGNEISLRGPLLERRMRFWDDIYSRYYRDPVPPAKPSLRHTEL